MRHPFALRQPLAVRPVAFAVAAVAFAGGCIDEGKHRRDNDALRRQVEAERSGAARARADSGRLRVERDQWRDRLAKLDADLARLRSRMQAAPNAAGDAGGQKRADAIRRLGALQERSTELRDAPPISDADAQALAKREAELTQLRWDKEDLERGLKEYAALLDAPPDPNAPPAGNGGGPQ